VISGSNFAALGVCLMKNFGFDLGVSLQKIL